MRDWGRADNGCLAIGRIDKIHPSAEGWASRSFGEGLCGALAHTPTNSAVAD
jgi:hypothetical protein